MAGGNRLLQTLTDILWDFSNFFEIFLIFHILTWKFSPSPFVDNQTNATWTPPLPPLLPPSSLGLGLSPNMKCNVSTHSICFFSMSDPLYTPATGPQHGAPHASLVAMVSVLFYLLLDYVLTLFTSLCPHFRQRKEVSILIC